jgi:Ca2+/H+ antiporter, TMEM165/GDT1 family
MNLEKVVFAFVILLAATLNFGFVYGGVDNPAHHHLWELFAATTINLIAVVLKFGDRTHIGAVQQAASLVALLQLLSASFIWFFFSPKEAAAMGPEALSAVVSLAAGALVANGVSVVILIVDTSIQRR